MSDEFNIKNIAKLASINLSEEEQDSLSNDLSIILEHNLLKIMLLKGFNLVTKSKIAPFKKKIHVSCQCIEHFKNFKLAKIKQ